MPLLTVDSGRVKQLFTQGKITISVLGLGRIGLPTAALFAEAGAQVIGADINREVVATIKNGKCRFSDEPGLPELVEKVVSSGRLEVTTDIQGAVSHSDAVIICVPTPVDAAKTPDYSAVMKAAHDIGNSIQRGSIVIIESTVGPGIIEEQIRPIIESVSELRAGDDFGLASCPERSDPGNIIKNMKTVPRIIGAIDGTCAKIIAAMYEAALGVKVVIVSNPKTANAAKLTENLFRDVNIALANEFALLYEKLGIDTVEVIKACSTKYNFMPHYPGAGVGGPCLPANPYYLIVEGMKAGNIPYLVRLAREINDRMPEHVVALVSEALNDANKTIKGSKIAILGVTYKPNVKDVQISPIERICTTLKQMGAQITIYDPMFKNEEVFGYKVESSVEDAAKGADCIVIGTAHREFQSLQLQLLGRLVNNRAALVDARNVVDPEEASKARFSYRGVGRSHNNRAPKRS